MLNSREAIAFVSLIVVLLQMQAQKQTSQWYFGQNAGLSFLTTPPQVLGGGAIFTYEGCASIADTAGNLLFYTDGITIWNQQHVAMANGTGLLGNGFTQTTQAAIIIQQPQSAHIYFVFTLDDNAGPNGLQYSVVNMTLAAGLGSVTSKNNPLASPCSEHLTAVKHCDGENIWVIAHDTSNSFRAFLVNNVGINITPVVSNLTPNTLRYRAGEMKASAVGNKIGIAVVSGTSSATGGFNLYDFDNSTGVVTNERILLQRHSAYGCEFSADGSKLYGSILNPAQIIQWDLCSNSLASIQASQFTVSPISSNTNIAKGTMQLAQDKKIYVARSGQLELGIIQNPNIAGPGCAYLDQGLALTTGTVVFGLPNFLSSYFYTKPSNPFISNTGQNCSTEFTVATCLAEEPTNVIWNFGDPASGASNSSTLMNSSHHYASPGAYSVQLIRNYKCRADTLIQPVVAGYSTPTLTISGDTTICLHDKKSLSASGANNYNWSNGSTSSTAVFSPTAAGTFPLMVTGTNTLGNCISSKTINIHISECVSITENALAGVVIFPNPTSSAIYINAHHVFSVKLYNLAGEVLLIDEGFTANKQIDLRDVLDGVYQLLISTKDLGTIHRKIVKISK